MFQFDSKVSCFAKSQLFLKISMKIKFILVILCFLAVLTQMTQAQNQRWFYVDKNINDLAFYLDKNFRILPTGNPQVWTKIIYPDDSVVVALVEWDCAEKKRRVWQETSYDSLGITLETRNGKSSWQYAVPDSVDESIHRIICRDNSKKTSLPKFNTSKAFAEIITESANLREFPSTSSSIIREVAIGERLILADAEYVGAWYKVIDPKTKNEGWLHGNTFKFVSVEKKRVKRKRTKKN